MENEGELKKRIGKLGSVELDYIDTAMCEVFAILDEAKLEFPCFPICKKYTSDMKNVSATDSKIRCDLGCFAWKDWFLKWFSDAK